MEKVICVELRSENSKNPRFNRAGDWRPRYIIWPEYNGLTKYEITEQKGQELDAEVDYQWGFILERTFSEFRQQNLLGLSMFKRVSVNLLPWSTRFNRFFQPWPPLWALADPNDPGYGLSRDYINDRQHTLQEDAVFLFSAEALSATDVEMISYQWVLDRATLLPLGVAMVSLGTSEAVMDLCITEHEESFMSILAESAEKFEHRVEGAARPFKSHKLLENKRDYGPGGTEF